MQGLKKLVRSTAFRLAIFYLLIFGCSSAVLLGFVFWRSASFTAEQIDQTISAEVQGLHERYRLLGIPGLTQVVSERSRRQSQSLYHLINKQGLRLAGNVDSWPKPETYNQGWMDFNYKHQVGDVIETRRARGREIEIAGGYRLLVGRDVQQRIELVELIQSAFWWAGFGILALGLLGGLFIGRQMLRRIDSMAAASAHIMAGHLAHRVPQDGSGDELDRLAVSLNAMLDRIEGLMNAVRQVSDNIAHDLRTPLNRLRARAEVTLMGEPDLASCKEALEKNLEEADALLGTFNALLDIARLEGSASGPRDPVNLGEIVADVADLYEPVAEDAQISLAVIPAGNPIVAVGDRRLLSQALANLVDNAIKYTEPGGRVWLSAERRDKHAVITVGDTGPGVPASDRDRIFDRFVRLDSDRGKPGNGLGLSLVRAVAVMHSAELKVEDGNPGLVVSMALTAVEHS
jgi:signal transduction histidine kinase